jgi:hypothetical protein
MMFFIEAASAAGRREAMKTRTRSKLVFAIALAAALAAGVGAVRAADPASHARQPEVQRIVPAAVPAELSPCMMGGCW